jgi:5-formyltetrahydrofolate cyclo-ligase
MRSGELKKAKREVRRAVLAARDALPAADRARRDRAIAERFLSLPEVRDARTVMAFWSFGSEVSTGPLLAALDAAGGRTALPRIVEGELEVRAFAPGDAVTPTSFGAMEPVDGEVLRPADVDVVCVPAVAFDRTGRRLGYGGGFYDRFLKRAEGAARVGVAYDVQVVAEDLPSGRFDLRVDAIATETETIRCGRDG